MQKAVIVYNPKSRNAPKTERLEALAAEYAPHGWEIVLRRTEAPQHAVDIAGDCAHQGIDAVFACGGDGTINEVVNGLAGSQTALGVIRGGMGNVFAKEVGVSRDPSQAVRVLLEGKRRRFDVGRVNGRAFLLMAGVGFDAAVVRAVPGGPKRLLGSTSYALWGLWQAAGAYRPRKVSLRIDGEEREARLYWLLLGNTRSYGGILNVTSEAFVNDGWLDTYVFEGGSPAWIASTALRLASRRQAGGRGVSFHHVRDLEVLTPGLPVQIDGEHCGETPARFTTEPNAVDILLPAGRGLELFL